jgi:methyl-accepting chemotaxis protein
MNHMKIGTKLIVVCSLLLTLILFVVIAAYVSMRAVEEKIVEMQARSIKVAQTYTLKSGLNEAYRLILLIVAADDPSIKKEAQQHRREYQSRVNSVLEELTRTSQSEAAKNYLAEYKSNTEAARAANNRIVELGMAGKSKEAMDIFVKESAPFLAKRLVILDTFIEFQEQKMREAEQKARSSFQQVVYVLFSCGAGALIIGFFGASYLIRCIKKPLLSAVTTFESVAKGDLTAAVQTDRTDEFGRMLTAVQAMTGNLKNLIGEIKTTTESLASGSTQLSAGAEEISRNMEEQARRIGQIATSAEEMSQTVLDVAKNASNIADSAKEAAFRARSGRDIVEKSIEESLAISIAVKSSATVMKELGDASRRIGEIVSVINDIADQTNLLALNAAIEAARAGDQGRGFAVVADEVRKLAERTSQATAEIGTMISKVQFEVSNAIDAMSMATGKVGQGVELSQNAGTSLADIVSIVEALQAMVHQIASATEEMSSVAEHISGDVHDVAHAAKEISLAADQIARTSSVIARQGGDLQAGVSQFKV